MAKKEVTKTKTTAMAAIDYGEHGGQGYEGQTDADVLIPFLNLLQKGSPLCDDRKDAKPGMLFNTVSEEVSDSLQLVPAITRHEFVEWIPRDDGGGFVGTHEPNSQIVRAAQADAAARGVGQNGLLTNDGKHELAETFSVFCVLFDGNEAKGMAVIPFSSSKIKVYKKYMSRLRMFTPLDAAGLKMENPPLYCNLAVIGSFMDEHPRYGKYSNFTLECAVNNKVPDSMLMQDDPRFQMAFDLYTMVLSGKAEANYETMGRQGKPEEDEELPY